jgi:hypothetical protein
MTIFGGLLLYGGLIAAAGLLPLLIPLRFLGIRSRKMGLLALGLGLLLFVASVYLPVSETRVAGARTRLDEFMPVYQFSGFHSVDVRASRKQIWRAMWEVRPEEIRFFETLMWMRGLGDSMAPQHRPILESFTAGAFQVLANDLSRQLADPSHVAAGHQTAGRGEMRRRGNNSRGSGV